MRARENVTEKNVYGNTVSERTVKLIKKKTDFTNRTTVINDLKTHHKYLLFIFFV